MQKSVLICLFRNDLRLHDHPGLTAAFHSKATHVLPLYVFDPVFMDLSNVPFVSFPAPLTWHYQFPRCHVHRSRFIFESVMDLKRSLKKKGSDLLIQFGPPEFVVESLVKQLKANEYDILGIHMSKEVIMRLIDLPKYTYEEELTEKRLLTLNVPIQFFHSSTMINLDRLPFSIDHLPNVYTQFRTEIEKTRDSIIPAALPVPSEWKPIPSESECILDSAVYGPGFSISLNTLKPAFGLDKSRDSRSAFPFQGGETAGKNRVKHYFFQTDLVKNYFNVRNGLCGVDYSTKFSPWLANGCLSARYILEELKKYEEERGNNKSTYWVWFELL
jgi:deoxyribodipyrimidine photo-lyase